MDGIERPFITRESPHEGHEQENVLASSENSDTGSDVIRLLRSTRTLLHYCSQESVISADRSSRELSGILDGLGPDPICESRKRHSWPELPRRIHSTKCPTMQLQPGQATYHSSTLLRSNDDHSEISSLARIPQKVTQCSASQEISQVCIQSSLPIPISSSLKSLRAEKLDPTASQKSPHLLEPNHLSPPGRLPCQASAGRNSATGLPDFVPQSPRSSNQNVVASGPGKKGKIAIQLFRHKPSVSAQYKSVQLKELKRMIRSGKPSFEQIHKWRHSFEALLNDRFGIALFRDFLSTEFSDENIEFWIACQEYKQISNPKKLAVRAQRIFDEFVAVQAEREVNLDSKTRLQTEEDLANPTIHTYDNAQKRIQALMEKDSYRRFLRSEVYTTLYAEAREVAKAVAASALVASLQDASSELDGALLNLVNSSTSNSAFSFFSNLGSTFSSSSGPGLHLPGVAAAAASADAGMNNIQDLQLLGLSTSRHMRGNRAQASTAQEAARRTKSAHDDDLTLDMSEATLKDT